MDSGSAGSRLAADRLDDSGAAARVQGRSRLLLRPYGRRRRILVNRRYQLKTALVGVTGMGFLVALIDGETSIQSLLDVAAMPPREVLHALATLRDLGIIRFRD